MRCRKHVFSGSNVGPASTSSYYFPNSRGQWVHPAVGRVVVLSGVSVRFAPIKPSRAQALLDDLHGVNHLHDKRLPWLIPALLLPIVRAGWVDKKKKGGGGEGGGWEKALRGKSISAWNRRRSPARKACVVTESIVSPGCFGVVAWEPQKSRWRWERRTREGKRNRRGVIGFGESRREVLIVILLIPHLGFLDLHQNSGLQDIWILMR